MFSSSLRAIVGVSRRSAPCKHYLLPNILESLNYLHTNTNKMSKFALANKYHGLEKNVW
jgi:hypothetical protein